MKLLQNKNRLVATILGILLMVILLSVTGYRFLLQDTNERGSGSNKIEVSSKEAKITEGEIIMAQKRDGVPFGRGTIPDSNLDYYWSDGTVIDGSYTCSVYDRETYRLVGSTYNTAGYGYPSTSGRTYYQNSRYDVDFIDGIISSYCKNWYNSN